jgi:ubiquinone/menaquinone biosynthesis C-methylase UbiE
MVEWFKGKLTQEQALINKHLTDVVLGDRLHLCEIFQIVPVLAHWSRIWEYSWILSHGFQPGQKVLDAGGGASPLSMYLAHLGCEVTNVDLEGRGFEVMGKYAPGITWVQGDIRDMKFEDKFFDSVVCCSVLEHVEQPLQAVKELRRVAKERLIITMDITTTERWNHTVDDIVAKTLLDFLGLAWSEPHEAKAVRFQEHGHDGKREEGSTVARVLGLAC